MSKKLRSKGRQSLTIEQWSRDNYPLPIIPDWVHSKHLRRRAKYRYRNGTVVIDIGSGWYVHSFRNGGRMLSVLPF
ncbi:MAG: hypothetical protein GC171_02180 [Terrimonas sp.]|nr:hypothetical protein [Terrimonas sp.]